MGNFQYKKRMIEFEDSESPKILIDGVSIHVSHDAEAGSFNSAELPYYTFESIETLAKAVVDKQLEN